jgi:hypothetical protein
LARSRAGGEGACARRRHRGVHLRAERIRSAQRGARRASVDATRWHRHDRASLSAVDECVGAAVEILRCMCC